MNRLSITARVVVLVTALAMLPARPAAPVAMAAPPPVNAAPPTWSVADRARITTALQDAPLAFIENRGQIDGPAAYYLTGRDRTIYFTPDGLTLAFSVAAPSPVPARGSDPQWSPSFGDVRNDTGDHSGSLLSPAAPTARWTVKLDFVGANPGVRPMAEDRREGIVSYFKGQPKDWHAGLSTYGRLVYYELWPGIDLVYTGASHELKYEFRVRPGADPALIRLAYRGIAAVGVETHGALQVETPGGPSFADSAPVAYQEIAGQRVVVSAMYEVGPQAGARADYSFRLGAYDPAQPLIVDPSMIVYCGYIGGAGDDTGAGIAVDSDGNAYVLGKTESNQSTFPVTVGPDLTIGGDLDAFVAKVRADGTGLVYCGYIGGSDTELGQTIAVDSGGNAYVTGETSSDETTFPVTGGPDLTHNGGNDAFVAKVRPDGAGLVYCGYIGGSGSDGSYGIAVDSAGNAYVTGVTTSNQSTFPETVGPDLTFGGPNDGFVAKVRADGTGLVYCGYIGGSGVDAGYGIAVDSGGNAYVTGITQSTQSTFPVTVGPDLTYNGGSDAFVAKVRADGTGLVYCGYIGGSSDDNGHGIAVDGGGNAYVIGVAVSTAATFPVTVGPDLTHNGGNDAFVAKVGSAGAGLVYCGYVGGSGSDVGYGIAVDSGGNAYVTGYTESNEATFPVTVGPDLTHNGGLDAFVAKVRSDGAGVVYCGYIGGSGTDGSYGIAVDSDGNAYVTGNTQSNQSTFPVTVGPDLTFGGTWDAFAAKIVPPDTMATDVHITLKNNPTTAAERAPYENMVSYFADGVFESSNGAHRIGTVTFHPKGDNAAQSDILWTDKCHPNANVAGVGTTGKHINMCDTFEKAYEDGRDYGFMADDAHQKGGGYTLAHEWGHYYYGLYDEYVSKEQEDNSVFDWPHTTDEPVTNSIMNSQWNAIDGAFQWLNFSVAKNETIANAQLRVYDACGWDTLVRPTSEDPRDGKRSTLLKRTFYEELTEVAPAAGADASTELTGSDPVTPTIVWAAAASPSPERAAAGGLPYLAQLHSMLGQDLSYPDPIVLLAFVHTDLNITGAGVIATVKLPDGSSVPILFADDGVAPDPVAGDGDYSAILGYKANGVYNIQVQFDNDAGTAQFVSSAFLPSVGPDGQPVPMAGPTPVGEDFAVSTTLQVVVSNVASDDHGNTPATATAIAALNTPLSGKIDNAGDKDVFRFTTLASGITYIRVTNLALGMSPRLRVLGPDGNTVLFDVSYPPTSGDYLVVPLTGVAQGTTLYAEVLRYFRFRVGWVIRPERRRAVGE